MAGGRLARIRGGGGGGGGTTNSGQSEGGS